MIAAWMIYSTAVALLLFAGAPAADYVVRALGAPARFVWGAAMLASLSLSGVALARGARQPVIYEVQPPAFGALQSARGAASPAPVTRWTQGTAQPAGFHGLFVSLRASAASLSQSAARLNVAKLQRWDPALAMLWAGASCAAFGWLVLSITGLRRLERTLGAELVDDHRILVSDDVGPAVFGVLDARIVVPRWVLSLPVPERRIILAHERQHAAALDPAMIYGAAMLLALQPWNAPLWAMFARLRLALEADCDRRVLGAHGDARQYGRLLVDVYARTTPALMPRVAFVQRPSNLERRIRRMTARPRLRSAAGAASVLAVLVSSTAAWTATAPARPAVTRHIAAPVRERQRVWQLEPVVTAVPRAGESAPSGRVAEAVTRQSAPTPADSRIQDAPAGPQRCIRDGRVAVSDGSSSNDQGCVIDGEIVVLALDSAHILVAIRDTTDATQQAINYTYIVFALRAGLGTPAVNGWAHHSGHVEIRGADFYVASAGGHPAVAFGISSDELQQSHPDATRFVISSVEILRRPAVTWDVLRQLPGASRCPASAPRIVVDGVIISDSSPDSACFVIDGRPVSLRSPS